MGVIHWLHTALQSIGKEYFILDNNKQSKIEYNAVHFFGVCAILIGR